MTQKQRSNSTAGPASAGGTWTMLEADEFENLRKFTSVLAFKSAGLIAEARSGEKHFNPCKAFPASTDWFGLAAHESAKIRAEVKELTRDHTPVIDKAFGVQIIAHLPTHEEIPLEYWWLWFDSSVRDQDARVSSVVYNRMGILLKSLIVVLRASPVNRLVQHNDYFKFSHRLFVGEPEISNLQSIAKHFKVGPLKTPYGAIYFSGACREAAFSDNPVSHPLTEPVPQQSNRISSSPKFEYFGKSNVSRSPDVAKRPLLADSPIPETSNQSKVCQRPITGTITPATHNVTKGSTFADLQYTGAFAVASKSPSDSDDDSYELPDKAFADLVSPPEEEDDGATDSNNRFPYSNDNKQPKSILKDAQNKTKLDLSVPKNVEYAPQSEITALSCLSFTDDGFEEDDVMDAELVRPAFAPCKTQLGSHDLASFYHECQVAPSNLKSLEKKGVSVGRTVKSLNQNLGGMESQLREFDRFVDDLRQVGDSSWVMTMSSH